ncbi:MAG TPA: thioredoxin domain-containing protein [Oligoflexia bacterium]|nr:thioredoxin domain-containing protein [Oligoflexia bacterium]HMP27194.1 thioredoxin domain-containing protein [Oligoflexia bacterium]
MKFKFLLLLLANVFLPVVFLANQAVADITDAQFEKMFEKFVTSDKGQAVLTKALQQYETKQREAAQKQAEARAKAELESQFKNPVKVDVGSSPTKGPSNAKITIVEFSDFQCPYCSRGKNVMEEVLKAYPQDVRLVFKNLPLPFHDQARPAARAALAAGKQGKFWEMHDALFDNQGSLQESWYVEKAKALGLDVEKFKKDMASTEIEEQIKTDETLARNLGIQGTPGFFVNGVAVKGAYPFDHFKMIIDRWLQKKA